MDNTSTELIGIGRVKIHPGRLEEYKRLSRVCLEIVRTKDTGTLQYDLFINAEGTECVFIERYRDSTAAMEHWNNIGPELMQQVLATGTFVGEILGNASPELRDNMKEGPVRLFTPLQSL